MVDRSRDRGTPGVGILVGGRRIGGTERQIAILAQGLLDRNVRTVLFFGDSRGDILPAREIAFPPGAPAYHLNADRAVRWRLDKGYLLARLMRKHDIGILHMFNLGSMELGRLALPFAPTVSGIGAVRCLRFTLDQEHRRRTCRAIGDVRPVSCNSTSIAAGLSLLPGMTTQRVFMIRNGIELPQELTPVEPEVPTVLFVGSLKKVKDPITFVRAAAIARQERPFMTRIVGDGDMREEVTRMLTELMPPGSWDMLGPLPPQQVPFDAADIVASSSLYEGGSNTVLEAMAHKVPVVATDAGANGEMIRMSGGGLLVPVGDHGAMAEAMSRLLSQVRMRHELGTLGRRYVEEHYGVDRMVEEHLGMYRKAVARRAR